MRDRHLHAARVYLAQARHFRIRDGHSGWPATLLNWAANQRRKAQSEPQQSNLFQGAA